MPLYKFPTKTLDYELPIDKYGEYARTYPDINLDQEFIKMRQWLKDNPRRRKTLSGMPRFINAWLSKSKPRGARDRTLYEDLTDGSWAE